jgi:ElaB/YqjD/DUF883 family membrane-anchored ribosome-binding protein
MSSGNQGRPQDQKDQSRQNGGAGGGGNLGAARDAIQNAGQQFQEKAGQAGERLREGYESAQGAASHHYRRAEGMVARNPAPSVLIGFGLGFGLGLVLTSLLAEREPESWADRYVPDRLRKIPGDLHDTLDQLSESVRNLPQAITRNLPGSLRG